MATEDEEKQSKNTTQYVLDTNICNSNAIIDVTRIFIGYRELSNLQLT